MVRRYIFALVGGVALAIVGMVLLEDAQVGGALGAVIGAGFGLTYGMLRDGA